MRHLIAIAVASFAATTVSTAQAADFALSGQISYHNDLAHIDFSVAAGNTVTLWTDSWQQGRNFDPTLALFSANGTLLAVNDDYYDDAFPDRTYAGAGGYDSGLTLGSLAAGSYRLVLGATFNAPVGTQLVQGFLYGSETPIALIDWNQPTYDMNTNDQKGGFWRLNLSGVEQAAVVPEPNRYAMLAAGLLSIALVVRRRQQKR